MAGPKKYLLSLRIFSLLYLLIFAPRLSAFPRVSPLFACLLLLISINVSQRKASGLVIGRGTVTYIRQRL